VLGEVALVIGGNDPEAGVSEACGEGVAEVWVGAPGAHLLSSLAVAHARADGQQDSWPVAQYRHFHG
jgi:hypothetical protein